MSVHTYYGVITLIPSKGWSKTCLMLLAISIDSDHMFYLFIYFIMHVNALAELVFKRVEDIVRLSFSTRYAKCIFYIRIIFTWLSCSLFFAPKMLFFFLLQFLILSN